MNRAWNLAKRMLFKLDAETAHHLTVRAVAELAEAAPHVLERLAGVLQSPGPRSSPEVMGMRFASAVGLAAGFDKNAELVAALPHLGFGFCEIGTVTPLPQAGNTRPRLMRDAASQSLFNRMGFNNLGAAQIAENLERGRKTLPPNFRVGVNVGKNKDTQGAEIARDYGRATAPFVDLADFFVINVSSPNTPGLRALQERESLAPIIEAVKSETVRASRHRPVLVKLAPELGEADLAALLEFFESQAIDGLVLTNTLAGQTAIGPGGWSGGAVRERAAEVLRLAHTLTKLPIISVGGIDSPEIARDRLRRGASLVELYSGWIFRGPQLPAQIAATL